MNQVLIRMGPHAGDAVSFQKITEQYLKNYLKVYRTGDLQPDISRLKTLTKCLPDTPVASDVLSFFTNLEGSPSTRNRYRALLRHMLNWADKIGYAIYMPTEILKQELETNQRDVRITLKEEMSLVSKFDSNLNALYTMACYTGLRRGALCQLTQQHVNLAKELITVPAAFQKQRRLQKIPMALPVRKLLVTRMAELDPDDKSPLFIWNRYQWDKARKAANLPHLRWHDLRHEFGSRLLEQKVALPTIQRLLGHSQITTTMRYLNATDVEDEDRAAIARLA